MLDLTATECRDPDQDANFSKSYDNCLDETYLITLKHQVETAKFFLQKDASYRDLGKMKSDLNKLSAPFDQLLRARKTVLTLSVSNASNERVFSVLKRVKT